MIITIDGPSASGKTTAARELAQQLGFELLRTGAMYRALALAAYRMGFDTDSTEDELKPHLAGWDIDADRNHVWLNGEDVSHDIDGDLMSDLSSTYAEFPAVRQHINTFIRRRAKKYLETGRSFVAEGRDQGSFVFPDANCKFYIDASLYERTHRRLKEMHHREDASKTFDQLKKEIAQRDERDSQRAFAPLCIPKDALVIDSTSLDKAGVLALLLRQVDGVRRKA
jgi:cytidylate kinase